VGLRVEGTVQLVGASVGQFTVAQGTLVFHVSTSAATANSNVLLTPLSDPLSGVTWWVDARAPGMFTVRFNQPAPGNITFQYLVVN
jgi:hypothetical protein